MHYNISENDYSIRYEYTFEDNTTCVISVSKTVTKTRIIDFHVKEKLLEENLCNALIEVSNIILNKDLTPTINIKKSNAFLRGIAQTAGFTENYSMGVSFSVWVKR